MLEQYNSHSLMDVGSQLPEASPTPESQGGTNSVTASQLPEADSGPCALEATMLRHPEAFSDPGSHEPSGSEPMEVDEPDPLGRGRTI
jgi:hypothetical protein